MKKVLFIRKSLFILLLLTFQSAFASYENRTADTSNKTEDVLVHPAGSRPAIKKIQIIKHLVHELRVKAKKEGAEAIVLTVILSLVLLAALAFILFLAACAKQTPDFWPSLVVLAWP